MGNEDDEDTQLSPKISLVYWVGDGMYIYRIITCANKVDKANRLGGTTKCEKVKKRDKQVKYLKDKVRKTCKGNKGNVTFYEMIDTTKAQIYTSKDFTERIVTIMTNTNNTWPKKGGGVSYTKEILYVIRNNIKKNLKKEIIFPYVGIKVIQNKL